MLPQDPYMLLSMINMKLRDENQDLDDLCKSFDIDKASLTEKLENIGYTYNPSTNQFK